VLGAAGAGTVHNLIFSGCNAEGAFSSKELRRYFVNATNIVHMASGELGYQSMFRQLLSTPSWNIQPAYETCARGRSGKLEYFTGPASTPKATRLNPYIADLFEAGATRPYRTQTAGRELLAPSRPLLYP
jgi:hypothetical protein